MASNPYVKSVLWLLGFGGAGYVLMRITAPNADKIERIKASTSATRFNADDKKKALFMEKLKEAATGTPIYRQPPTVTDKKDN